MKTIVKTGSFALLSRLMRRKARLAVFRQCSHLFRENRPALSRCAAMFSVKTEIARLNQESAQ